MVQKISNWGGYPAIQSQQYSFTQAHQLKNIIKQHQPLIARGNGRCYGDASLSQQVVSTLMYDKVLSFDTELGVFECQAGILLEDVLQIIVPAGWFLPVTPGTKLITIGGAVACDVHGKNHHIDGSFCRHVIDMDVMTGDGNLINCSPTSYNDLFSATCGGMGLTGVITRVKFRLKKIETAFIQQKKYKAKNLEHVLDLFESTKHYTYSVAWIDCLKKGAAMGRSILLLGEHASLESLPASQRSQALQIPIGKKLSIPVSLPEFALNSFTVKAFNELYYNRMQGSEREDVIHYEPFFYPLDAILHWNRGYGKSGFIQYQFVLPKESKLGLIKILEAISNEGLGSFLAVLKVFGEQNDLISFPMEGYTLALDFPIRKGLFEFCSRLDAMVEEYGGRLYLTKDARMSARALENGYPHLSQFLDIVKKYNPGFSFRSLQSDRLNLNPA